MGGATLDRERRDRLGQQLAEAVMLVLVVDYHADLREPGAHERGVGQAEDLLAAKTGPGGGERDPLARVEEGEVPDRGLADLGHRDKEAALARLRREPLEEVAHGERVARARQAQAHA